MPPISPKAKRTAGATQQIIPTKPTDVETLSTQDQRPGSSFSCVLSCVLMLEEATFDMDDWEGWEKYVEDCREALRYQEKVPRQYYSMT